MVSNHRTKKFCGCNVGPCNKCFRSVLTFGLVEINAPVGFCNLHVHPLFILSGTGSVALNEYLDSSIHQELPDLAVLVAVCQESRR